MIKNVNSIKTIRKIFILFIAFCLFSEFIFPNLFSKFSISEASARSKDRSKPVEIISNRDIYSKHYLNSDGTITAIINSAPVHYKNTFGEYEDIDLTITSAGNDKAQKSNIKNNFKIYFEDKNDSKNTTYACMEITNRNGDARWISYKLAGAKSSSDDHYKNKFTFSNVFENVDLEYEINTTQLKENIIIAQPINNYEFNFIIEVSEGITLAESVNGEIIASDNITKEELFIIAKPFAEDSNGLRTNDVTQEIEKKSYKGKEYDCIVLKLEDDEFLTNAVFPITIDPTTTPVADTWIGDDGDTYSYNFGDSQYMEIGWEAEDDECGYALLKFSLDNIPSNAVITNSNLTLTNYSEYVSEYPLSLYVFRVTSDWTEMGASFDDNITYDTTYNSCIIDFDNANINDQNSVDVTNYVSNWKQNNYANYGFIIAPWNDLWGVNQIKVCSKEHSVSSYRPALAVTYLVPSTVTINSPNINQVFCETDTAFYPQIIVQNSEDYNLTCKVYIDNESTPRDTQTATETYLSEIVTFNAIDMSTLSEGNHIIKYSVSDGVLSPIISTVNIKVDKTPPVLCNISVSSTINDLTITGSATDSISGLAALPYMYTVGSSTSSWLSSTTYTKQNLNPNTSYIYKFEAKDTINHIASSNSQYIYTKAQVPILVVDNASSSTLDVSTTDSNPAYTEYQIFTGIKYVTSSGTLSDTPTWITLTNKKITVTGLTQGNTYSFQAKARNGSNVETNISTAASDTVLEVIAETILPFEVSCILNELKTISLKATDITDFCDLSFTLTYDINELEIIDLCASTFVKELCTGQIENGNIIVTHCYSGTIKFIVTKSIATGKSWSGTVNNITIKSKITGNIDVVFIIEKIN